jgi:hypothetical protein
MTNQLHKMTFNDLEIKWHICSIRWLRILYKALEFDSALSNLNINNNIIYPCTYNLNKRILLLPKSSSNITKKELTIRKQLIIDSDPTLYNLIKTSEGYNISPDNLSPNIRYFLYNPYIDYIKKYQKITQDDILSFFKYIQFISSDNSNVEEKRVRNKMIDISNKAIVFISPDENLKLSILTKTITNIVKEGYGEKIFCLSRTHESVQNISSELKKLGVDHVNNSIGTGALKKLHVKLPYLSTIESYLFTIDKFIVNHKRTILFLYDVDYLIIPKILRLYKESKTIRIFGKGDSYKVDYNFPKISLISDALEFENTKGYIMLKGKGSFDLNGENGFLQNINRFSPYINEKKDLFSKDKISILIDQLNKSVINNNLLYLYK